ncbi:MAG: hypothetical protein WDM80_05185 [Limisphaerales bacterium]
MSMLLVALAWFGGTVSTQAQFDISTPPNWAVVHAGTNVLVDTVNPPVGTGQVSFYLDDVQVFAVTSPPFQFTVGNITEGSHTLYAVATTGSGSVTSSVVNITAVFDSASPPLISNGSLWRFNETGEDLGPLWVEWSFNDDATWPEGAGELGYGDTVNGRPEKTLLGQSGKPVTTYFRQTFMVQDPAQIQALDLRLLCDDGAVVYINGEEVFRYNMPTGHIAASTLALTAEPQDGAAYLSAIVTSQFLIPGPNVIAVEVHQASTVPDDLSFDLMLFPITGGTPVGDCNNNGILDSVDIADGTSLDNNLDGIPDECQVDLRLWQESFINSTGEVIDPYTDYALLEARVVQPPPGEVIWLNLVRAGEWVVQNLPIQARENRAGLPARHYVSFNLGNTPGVVVSNLNLAWTLTKNALTNPPVINVSNLLAVAEKRVYPSTEPETNAPPSAAELRLPARNFTNAPAGPVAVAARRGMPTLSEEVNHCAPGGGARCLGWLNSQYDLGVTNSVKQFYDALKGTNYMKTSVVDGTFFSDLVSGMSNYVQSAGLSNRLTVTLMAPTNPPATLARELQAGQDIIMRMGYYRPFAITNAGGMVTNEWRREGGHIVVGSSITTDTNGQITINFNDDCYGEDAQGDGRPDRGISKPATVVTVTNSVLSTNTIWELHGFGSWSIYEGFVKICPQPVLQVKIIKEIIVPKTNSVIEGVKARILRYWNGAPWTPQELRELLLWTAKLRDDTGYLLNNLEVNGYKETPNYMVAQLQLNLAQSLQGLTVDYVRSNLFSILNAMLPLAEKLDLTSDFIGDCLTDPANCANSRPFNVTISPGPIAAALNWPADAKLQWSATPVGPWTTISNIVPPTTVNYTSSMSFFRAEKNPVFGCLYAIIPSSGTPAVTGDFILIKPWAGGACPTPIYADGKWQFIIVNPFGVELGRVIVAPYGIYGTAEALQPFTTTVFDWYSPSNPTDGKIVGTSRGATR